MNEVRIPKKGVAMVPVALPLKSPARFRGRPVIIISRCYVAPDWLYGLRIAGTSEVINYIPAGMIDVE